VTDAGDMPGVEYLIHVAGLNTWWRSTPAIVSACVRSAVKATQTIGVTSRPCH